MTSDFDNLTDEQAQAELDEMATAFYKTSRWKAAFARDVELQPETVVRWFNTRPPKWAILLLDAWGDVAKLRRIEDAIGKNF